MPSEAAFAARPATAQNAARGTRVLLIEDSARLAASIRDYLEQHGFEVTIEGDGLAAASRFERLRPDLVILDLMLPGKDGLALCREIRRGHQVPILILTARGENIDQVLGLEMGADDYVVKPVEPRVLLARIEAILRRSRSETSEARDAKLAIGRLAVDAARRSATIAGKPVELTTGDFDILMLPATLAFVALMYLTDQVMAQIHAEQMRARAAGAFERAERIINDSRVPDWRGRLKLVEATFGVEHRIVRLADARDDWFISASEVERLEAGHIPRRDPPRGGPRELRRGQGTGKSPPPWGGGAFPKNPPLLAHH